MNTTSTDDRSHAIFFTRLGWMGLLASANGIRRAVFGYPSANAVAEVLQVAGLPQRKGCELLEDVEALLKDYASGIPVDLFGVPLDIGSTTKFQGRVVLACRAIPYGETRSYGELAMLAGSPRAARAVGNCMAGNPVPLLVPCHRVVKAGNCPGPFSAPGGAGMKVRLLRMEKAANHRGLA
jgi:methylated-DNA-[protein]-cysteine S-methyltransferase